MHVLTVILTVTLTVTFSLFGPVTNIKFIKCLYKHVLFTPTTLLIAKHIKNTT